MSIKKGIEYQKKADELYNKAQNGEIQMNDDFHNKMLNYINLMTYEFTTAHVMKCLDCGIEMGGFEDFEVCPNCGSENIENRRDENYLAEMKEQFANNLHFIYECPIDGKMHSISEITTCPKCGLPVARIQ